MSFPVSCLTNQIVLLWGRADRWLTYSLHCEGNREHRETITISLLRCINIHVMLDIRMFSLCEPVGALAPSD